MNRCIVLLALVGLLGGCQGKPQKPANLNVWYDTHWPYVLVQADLYEIAAYDVVDGRERWRYRRQQPPPAPFGTLPVPTVICRPEWTASHNVVLRFPDEIHVLTAESGELLWRQKLPNDGTCPAVTPDSGIVVLVQRRTRLQKLDGDGRQLWHHDFWETGVAVAGPIVVRPSGDTLIRTPKFLLNISPDGERNWAAPTAQQPDPT